jgi:hypothetical protein
MSGLSAAALDTLQLSVEFVLLWDRLILQPRQHQMIAYSIGYDSRDHNKC